MDSLTYYQTLTKKELKERLKYAEMKLNDANYRLYLAGSNGVDISLVEDLDNIKLALSKPKAKSKKTKPVTQEFLTPDYKWFYELRAEEGWLFHTTDDQDLAESMQKDLAEQGIKVILKAEIVYC